MVYERVRGWTSAGSLPVQNFVKYPPPPGSSSGSQVNFVEITDGKLFLSTVINSEKVLKIYESN